MPKNDAPRPLNTPAYWRDEAKFLRERAGRIEEALTELSHFYPQLVGHLREVVRQLETAPFTMENGFHAVLAIKIGTVRADDMRQLLKKIEGR